MTSLTKSDYTCTKGFITLKDPHLKKKKNPIHLSSLCLVTSPFPSQQVEQPLRNKKCVWQKLLSKQRKRAVVACFRMAPLYNLPR